MASARHIDDHGASSELSRVVAENVRRLRESRRLTLGQLAVLCGVSKATLSKLELAVGNPTLDTLAAVAAALSSSVAELAVEVDRPTVHVVRSSEGANMSDSAASARLIHVLRLPGVVTEVHELSFAAGEQDVSATHGDDAWEHAYALSGEVAVGPLGDEVVLLPGDCASYRVDRPHSYRAHGPQPARVLIVLTIARQR